MPTDVPLARQGDAFPIVQSAADRDAQFPFPTMNLRVYNLGTQAIERWAGSWAPDIFFATQIAQQPQTFGGLITASAGLLVNGPATDAGFTDYLLLNGSRADGAAIKLGFLGSNPTGVQDIHLENDGQGNFYVVGATGVLLQIAGNGNITQVQGGAVFFSQTGGHQIVEFTQTNPASSQTNVVLTRTPAGFATGRPLWITGITVRTSAAVTGGIGTVTLYSNGVATAVTQQINIGQTFANTVLGPGNGAIQLAAGSILDLRITTVAGWTFTTGTLVATVEVLC